MTTHAIVLSREQVENLREQFTRIINENPDVLGVFVVASDEAHVHEWFDEAMAGEQPAMGDLHYDSVSIGDVFTLLVDYEVTPEVLALMGMEEVP